MLKCPIDLPSVNLLIDGIAVVVVGSAYMLVANDVGNVLYLLVPKQLGDKGSPKGVGLEYPRYSVCVGNPLDLSVDVSYPGLLGHDVVCLLEGLGDVRSSVLLREQLYLRHKVIHGIASNIGYKPVDGLLLLV